LIKSYFQQFSGDVKVPCGASLSMQVFLQGCEFPGFSLHPGEVHCTRIRVKRAREQIIQNQWVSQESSQEEVAGNRIDVSAQ
jgi:hypothetical protein